jgi:hypothetical protein
MVSWRVVSRLRHADHSIFDQLARYIIAFVNANVSTTTPVECRSRLSRRVDTPVRMRVCGPSPRRMHACGPPVNRPTALHAFASDAECASTSSAEGSRCSRVNKEKII